MSLVFIYSLADMEQKKFLPGSNSETIGSWLKTLQSPSRLPYSLPWSEAKRMLLRALAARAAKHTVHEARIKIPPSVEISKIADELIFSGPLGTSRTGLSRIDGLGHAALKLVPDEREIAICTSSKAFFGTLQVREYACARSTAHVIMRACDHHVWCALCAPECRQEQA